MANEYRISQVAGEALITLPRVATARVSQVRAEVLMGHVKKYPEGGLRYYRFRFLANVENTTDLRIGEIAFFDPMGNDITFPCLLTTDPAAYTTDYLTNYDNASEWANNNVLPITVVADFKDAGTVQIGSYSVQAWHLNALRSPAQWVLESSPNGADWTIVDERIGLTWTSNEKKTFVISGVGEVPRRRNFGHFFP